MHRVRTAAATLLRELVELEPGTFAPADAALVVEELASIENACGAAKARMAVRAAEGGGHRGRGFADPSDWLAHAAGTTVPEARRQIDAVSAVEQCPETHDALMRGEVSLAQAGEIARTAREAPGCEHELLVLAKGASLGAVRDRARQRRVEAIDHEELYTRQRKAREFSHWRDELGMVRGSFALTPDVGVAWVNRIDAETDRLRREAKRAGGVAEPRAALAADALVRVAAGSAATRAGTPAMNVVIDWPALARGHVHPGERSHIVDGGPIPPRIVVAMLGNAFVKAVVTDGVDVQQVRHFGRRMSAELRTALELGPPPEFNGVSCEEAGCERRYGLEWDHKLPVARRGPTSRANLQPLCIPHHWEKTERDRQAGLLRSGASVAADRAPP